MPSFRTAAQDAAHLETAEDREVEVEDHQVGRLGGDGLQRVIACADDERLGLAGALERVLDQTGDVVLVLDDEDSVPGHKETSATAEGTGRFVGRPFQSRL